jgi:CubicO group peptidase (beta-lactamase class C family)
MNKLFAYYLLWILLTPEICAAKGKEDGIPAQKLNRVLHKTVDNKKIYGAVVCIYKNGEQWTAAAGNLDTAGKYFIASATKLYITAVIMKLRAQNRIQLTDPISHYLDSEVLGGLHTYKGNDYVSDVTVGHLLSNTSGIPDYFEQKKKGESSLRAQISNGNDKYWSFEEAVSQSKKMKPKHKPGTHKKALYSDTNFQLLGKIIERITGQSLGVVFQQYIFEPLGLVNTYLYSDTLDTAPALMYYKSQKLHIPKAMASFGADGGIVATAAETMKFTRAFYGGQLFPKQYIPEMQLTWNRIFFPLRYGTGMMKYQNPAVINWLARIPPMVGHSGLSGAFVWYVPAKDVFITGTVNQINNPSSSYKMVAKMVSLL